MTITRGSEGCFGMNIYIDEFPVEELELTQLKQALADVINSIKTKESCCDLFYSILTQIGEYVPDEDPCDDCGTWGGEYTINTNKQ